MASNDDASNVFIYESGQQLDSLRSLLLDAEEDGKITSSQTAELFRLVHTLKGSAAMMGYAPLADTTHRLEDVLSWLRSQTSSGSGISGKTITAITAVSLDFADTYQNAVANADGGASSAPLTELNRKIDGIGKSVCHVSPSAKNAAPSPAADSLPQDIDSYEKIRVRLDHCGMAALRAYMFMKAVTPLCEKVCTIPQRLNSRTDCDDEILKEGFQLCYIKKNSVKEDEIESKIRGQALFSSMERLAAQRSRAVNTASLSNAAVVTVSSEKLASLMGLMTEEMALHTQFLNKMQELGIDDPLLANIAKDIMRCSQAMQNTLGRLSLIEISQTFLPMKRLSRSLLAESGKKARIVLSGGNIMVDKGVLESLNAALLHLIRNAVDHGIEPPEQRTEAGKPETGTIEIAATQERERLIVFVKDDGRGISRAKVLSKAKEKKLLTKPENEYTQQEIYDFILKSGFSTNEKVSQYSGRGVGLDVVNHAIKKIGGSIAIESVEGEGSTITLNMPVALAVMEALTVTTNGVECCIPCSVIYKVAALQSIRKDGHFLIFENERYTPLAVSASGKEMEEILFRNDMGRFYLPCDSTGSYIQSFALELPLAAAQILREDNIYLGCMTDRMGHIKVIIDIDRLIKKSIRIKEG